MKRTVYPFKLYCAISLFGIPMSTAIVLFFFSGVVESFGWSSAGRRIVYLVVSILPLSIGLIMLLGSVGLFIIARPIRLKTHGLVVGWIIRETLEWQDITDVILSNKGTPSICILSEYERRLRPIVERAYSEDMYMWYYCGRLKITKYLQKLVFQRKIKKDTNIELSGDYMPRKMIVLPLQDDVLTYIRNNIS